MNKTRANIYFLFLASSWRAGELETALGLGSQLGPKGGDPDGYFRSATIIGEISFKLGDFHPAP